MKPREILLVLLSIYAVLAAIMFLFPENGINLSENYKLQFVTSEEFFDTSEQQQADISDILAQSDIFKQEELLKGEELVDDTTSITGSEPEIALRDTIKPTLYKLQFPEEGPSVLYRFWKKMAAAKPDNKLVRIMHYGDSQIEADRITSFLRNKLQREFGGSGAGMRPLKQAFDYQATMKQNNEGEWWRYAVYGRRDTTLNHNKYGALTAFSRFSPHQKKPWLVQREVLVTDTLPADSLQSDSLRIKSYLAKKWVLQEDTTPLVKEYTASVSFSKSNISYYTGRKFRQVRLFYADNRLPFHLETTHNEAIKSSDSISVTTGLQVKKWRFDDYTNNFALRFSGKDSPDLYGLAFDDLQGVAVDNIAMRGSSGTVFRKMDPTLLRSMYKELNVGLLILQFGGNVTPYMRDNYQFYERSFYSQLLRFKKLMPNVAIVVIGPADMSRKEKDKYVSYENIPMIRDALRSATFRAGGAFWDMYEAMGGKNSMPSWVNHKPALAAKDFIHFNPKGARVIAEMFYKSFIEEYREYQRNPKK